MREELHEFRNLSPPSVCTATLSPLAPPPALVIALPVPRLCLVIALSFVLSCVLSDPFVSGAPPVLSSLSPALRLSSPLLCTQLSVSTTMRERPRLPFLLRCPCSECIDFDTSSALMPLLSPSSALFLAAPARLPTPVTACSCLSRHLGLLWCASSPMRLVRSIHMYVPSSPSSFWRLRLDCLLR